MYKLKEKLRENLVGQNNAINQVVSAIRRKEYGWSDDDHPLVFLFLGPSGTGKTEMAKQIADHLHKDNEEGFIRLDMSEYQEKHSMCRFIGAPQGYYGHSEGGQLTNALKKCNNALVLFDEIEKAHTNVLTVMLQLFDEGRITDTKNNVIECKDAVFVMTSNLASEAINEYFKTIQAEQPSDGSNGDEDYQKTITMTRKFKDNVVRPILKAHFQRDEFLGRITEMVFFVPFSDVELKHIITRQLLLWEARAKNKNKVELSWDDGVVDVISKGYDNHYGVRSIKHEIVRQIINQISELHDVMEVLEKVHIGVDSESSIKVQGT